MDLGRVNIGILFEKANAGVDLPHGGLSFAAKKAPKILSETFGAIGRLRSVYQMITRSSAGMYIAPSAIENAS